MLFKGLSLLQSGVFCVKSKKRADHQWNVLEMQEPKLSWRDDDLWIICRFDETKNVYSLCLILSAFCWQHPHWWFPWSQLMIVWTCLFYPSWLAKDRSMSRYPQWAQYTSVSGEHDQSIKIP